MPDSAADVAVIGGGILGCTTALHLARGGLRTVVVEAAGLCMGASSRNAGTLAIQYPRAELTPYAMKAWEMWRDAGSWLGRGVGYREIGGLVLAFTDAEAERLRQVAGARRDAGAPIEFLGANAARELEPGLTADVKLASYCAIDAYADSTIIGRVLRQALMEAGVDLRESHPVTRIDSHAGAYRVAAGTANILAKRLVLAGGTANGALGRLVGLDLPVGRRINQMIVTERLPPVVTRMLGVVSGRLSLKQKPNGTVLIGGGWTGVDGPTPGSFRADHRNFTGNLRLAGFAIPALRQARVVRSWFGVRDHYPDYMPTIGPLDANESLFIIASGVSGYTLGPYLGRLLAERITGGDPDLAGFRPSRWLGQGQTARDYLT